MIIYLHGFMSGPGSHKAQVTARYLQSLGRGDEFACPALSPYPAQAIAALQGLLARQQAGVCLIGSSLGGYYALHLAEQFNCAAVLINPAMRPYEDLLRFLGPQQSPWTGERFTLHAGHIDELKALAVTPSRLERYLLLTCTGDEVLDYRLGVEALHGATLHVLPGGDHAFADYGQWVARAIGFADRVSGA